MEILDVEGDIVIDGAVSIGSVSYDYALNNLIPLINKTDFQRKLQDKKFYKKLERDIEVGCVMPPITIAFITTEVNKSSLLEEIKQFVERCIHDSFVLDGIQRLNTLSRLSKSTSLDLKKKLYVNFIFCDSVEKLLYRMITLNNGQRPMTPRHQVEVMLANVFDFSEIGINVQTEKQRAEKANNVAFKKADIIQAYLAFMASSPMIDNKKIIQGKMDDLLVNKIISNAPSEYSPKFEDVLKAIKKFQDNPVNLKWLKISNNLVGFTVGMRKSNSIVLSLTDKEFETAIQTFDLAFSDFNPSRIKVGKYRRELSCEYFKNFNKLQNHDSDELLEYFSEITNE